MVGSVTLYDALYENDLLFALDLTSSSIYIINVVIGSKYARFNEVSFMLRHKRLCHISGEKNTETD